MSQNRLNSLPRNTKSTGYVTLTYSSASKDHIMDLLDHFSTSGRSWSSWPCSLSNIGAYDVIVTGTSKIAFAISITSQVPKQHSFRMSGAKSWNRKQLKYPVIKPCQSMFRIYGQLPETYGKLPVHLLMSPIKGVDISTTRNVPNSELVLMMLSQKFWKIQQMQMRAILDFIYHSI